MGVVGIAIIPSSSFVVVASFFDACFCEYLAAEKDFAGGVGSAAATERELLGEHPMTTDIE